MHQLASMHMHPPPNSTTTKLQTEIHTICPPLFWLPSVCHEGGGLPLGGDVEMSIPLSCLRECTGYHRTGSNRGLHN